MKTIVFFGDSTMAGRGVPKGSSYVSLVIEQLQGRSPDRLAVYDLAVLGETLAGVLARFVPECDARYTGSRAELHAVLSVGINDVRRAVQGDDLSMERIDFSRLYGRLLKFAIGRAGSVTVLGIANVDLERAARYMPGVTRGVVAKFNADLRRLCNQLGVRFIDAVELLGSMGSEEVWLDDGIHWTAAAHRVVAGALAPQLAASVSSSLDQRGQLAGVFPGFKSRDYRALVDYLPVRSGGGVASGLVVGAAKRAAADAVVGGCCIRKDIEGVSFNTFYQALMPMVTARDLGVPCYIFLGVREEALLRPSREKKFISLGQQLAGFIGGLAAELGVDARAVDTNDPSCDLAISRAVDRCGIQITPEESTYLFNVTRRRVKRPIHSEDRAAVSARVLACHTSRGLSAILGVDRPLIVEDIEQVACHRVAGRYDGRQRANFLGFIPAPSLDGSEVMFRAEIDRRLMLGQAPAYYERLYDELPDEVLFNISEALRIYSCYARADVIPLGKEFFVESLLAISRLLPGNETTRSIAPGG